MIILVAGCGGDKLIGDWMTYGKGYRERPLIYILHIEKSDNGIYLISREDMSYQYEWAKDWSTGGREKQFTSTYDEILNSKEAFVWKKSRQILMGPNLGYEVSWNGTPLKIAKIYKRKDSKDKNIIRAREENLPLKDGKLLFGNAYFEKTDKAGIDKAMANWKEDLKKEVGKEIVCTGKNADLDRTKMKGIIARVTIIENGKEEVFE